MIEEEKGKEETAVKGSENLTDTLEKETKENDHTVRTGGMTETDQNHQTEEVKKRIVCTVTESIMKDKTDLETRIEKKADQEKDFEAR